MNRIARAASALVVFLVASGCSSPEPLWVTTSTAIPIVGSLAESISSAQLSVSQGGSAGFTITLTPSGGFSGLVQFAPIGSQSGVTFLPASVTLSGSEPVSVQMTVSASIDATPGTSTVTLAAAAGNQAAQVAFTLSVLAVQPSPLVADPTSLALVAGGSDGSVTVSEANYSGAFTEGGSCANLATITQATPGVFAVAPSAAGDCVLIVIDAFEQTVSIPVSITAG